MSAAVWNYEEVDLILHFSIIKFIIKCMKHCEQLILIFCFTKVKYLLYLAFENLSFDLSDVYFTKLKQHNPRETCILCKNFLAF